MPSGYWSELPSSVEAVGTTPARAFENFDGLFALGTDHHQVPVPLARMVENVLDWEHLPHVHPENFVSSALIAQGPGWYRARFGNAPGPMSRQGSFNQVLVLLHANEPAHSRWSILLEEGPRAGHMVYTRAWGVGASALTTEVTFYAPAPPRNEAVQRAMFQVFKQQYDMLYGQDTVMMSERQRALEQLSARASDVAFGVPLGSVGEVTARAPFVVTVLGRRFWIRVDGGELEVVAADCPHQRGPLPCPAHGETLTTCPWHGYRFDVRTGRSADGRALRLDAPPALEVVDGQVQLARRADRVLGPPSVVA